MCTSLNFLSKQGDNFLCRTMDFGFNLDGRPVVIPRRQHFKSDASKQGYETKYAFIGTGRNIGSYILVDGVNEKGFSGAALYLNGETSYQNSGTPGKINLASHELLNWILGNIQDCKELKNNLNYLNIVSATNALLKIVAPLHWIFTDRTGACYILEINSKGMHYIKNPVGVLTNSPDFNWHLKNLNNYIQLQPQQHPSRKYGQYKISGIGSGTGGLGLPGDYTSPSRFIRAVFLKENSIDVPTSQVINSLIHILNSVEIPKGIKLTKQNIISYTQYRSYLDTGNLVYYIQPYDNQNLYQIKLTKKLIYRKKPYEFPIFHKQEAYNLENILTNKNK